MKVNNTQKIVVELLRREISRHERVQKTVFLDDITVRDLNDLYERLTHEASMYETMTRLYMEGLESRLKTLLDKPVVVDQDDILEYTSIMQGYFNLYNSCRELFLMEDLSCVTPETGSDLYEEIRKYARVHPEDMQVKYWVECQEAEVK